MECIARGGDGSPWDYDFGVVRELDVGKAGTPLVPDCTVDGGISKGCHDTIFLDGIFLFVDTGGYVNEEDEGHR